MAEHINKTDTLNEGRVKLNAAISDSNIAKGKAEQADVKSTQALANSESTQTQLDTIVIEGDSSVEAAQARVDEKGEGHATLKARIDDGFERTSSQLAQTEQEVDTLKLIKVDKSEVENALNLKRDKTVPIGLNDADAELLTAIQGGEGTSFNLLSVPRDHSVSPNKTTFIKQSTNLFNKNDAISGYTIDGNTGELIENQDTSVSKAIAVDPSTSYTIKKSDVISGRYALYDESDQFILSVALPDADEVASFVTPENAHILRVVTNNNDLDIFQVNKGTEALPYEEYYTVLDPEIELEDKSITSNKRTALGEIALILLDGNAELPNLNSQQTQLEFPSPFSVVSGSKRFRIPTGVNISYHDSNNASSVIYFNTESETFRAIRQTLITQNVEEDEIVIAVINRSSSASGSIASFFINCDYLIDGKPPYENGKGGSVTDKPYHFNNEPLVGNYESGELPACDGRDPEGFDHETVMHTDIYDAFDEFVTHSSDYISKTELGLDTSETLPINYYDFNPPEVNLVTKDKPLPKILIGTAAHGDGWTFYPELGDGSAGDPPTSVFALYYFLKDLVFNWQGNPLLEYIRWNVRLGIVPLQNPWGFNNRSRFNSRGVDLNRNYDYAFELGDHSGTAPFSEKETQYMRDLIIQHKDAIHFADYHTISTSGRPDNVLQDIRTNAGGPGIYVANHSISKVSRMWKGKYSLLDSELNFYGTIDPNPPERAYAKKWAEYEAGVFSVTLESFPAVSGKYTLNSSEVIQMNTEFIGNWIINVLRYFQNK